MLRLRISRLWKREMHLWVYLTIYKTLANDFETVTAIANYTTRVAQTSLSASQRQEALKFLGTYTFRKLRLVIHTALVDHVSIIRS